MKQNISKTKIEKKASKKTNKELAKLINSLKKINLEYAHYLSFPKRKRIEKNLDEIEKETKENDVVFVPGKVLSSGELNKKIKIIAWKFSEKAVEKIKKSKSEAILIEEELKKNPQLKGVKLLK
ncbi:MAG: 50S ribosomal protein L18e [Candidatus Pacearchaeota archaeon]